MKNVSVILLCLVMFAGCSTPPITDAVCVAQCLDTWDDSRVLIWTNEPRIEPLLVEWVGKQGGRVVKSVTVGDSMYEQDLEAQLAKEAEHSLQQLGRNVGANRILIGIVQRHSYPLYRLYSGYKEGHPRVTTIFDPTVTILSMNVADEITQWRVTAKGTSTSFTYDSSVTELANTALERAVCEANFNMRWTDERGCVEKSEV